MRFLFSLVLILFLFSCSKSQTTTTKTIEKPTSSIAKKHDEIITIDQKFESKIEAWAEYENFTNFIKRYITISAEDAINNSRELNLLTKSLNDSIIPKFLETPAFNARLNLLLNETLRLYDMSSIPSIKTSEVDNQVTKVLEAFSSVNSKINTIIQQIELDAAIDDVDFNKERYDTTEIFEKPKEPEQNIQKKLFKRTQKIKLQKDDFSKKKKSISEKTLKKKKTIKKKDN